MIRRALVPALLLVAACSPSGPREALLHLEGFRQAGRQAVSLNESLVLHFSADIDQASVTSESVRVLAASAEPVPGTFEVRRRRIEFHPRLPREADLSDGGFLPGRGYEIMLLGFPRPDGLRGRRGEPLARTLRLPFRTVERTRDEPLYLDLAPGAAPVLTLVEREIGPLGPILIECDEALDPTSLEADDFDLRGFVNGEEGGGRRDGLRRIRLRARLVANEEGRARIELRPLAGDPQLETLSALDPGSYYLHVDPARLGLRTLGRRPLKPGWGSVRPLEIRVLEPRPVTFVERFQDTARRSPEPFVAADGTAHWDSDGRVRIRFPVAAGTGVDGQEILAGREPRTDVHATRLRVVEDTACELSGEGLVVLRAQGRLEVAGHLIRRVEPSPAGWMAGEEYEAWRLRTGAGQAWAVPSPAPLFAAIRAGDEPAPTLSAWLEDARRSGIPWTVLVAGGDLVVRGRIEIDGPLVLVAGGWIRVFGRVATRENWLIEHQEGGGDLRPPASRATLAIDEPVAQNPLQLILRLAVLSDPIRPPRGVSRWRSALFAGQDGGGSARVRFLGVRSTGDLSTESYGPVRDLALLEGCESVRFLVELELPPGGVWDPPSVERVEVSWYEPPLR